MRYVENMTVPGRIRSLRMALRKAGYPAIDHVDATFLRFKAESYETIEEAVEDMMAYVESCQAGAAEAHRRLLARLDQGLTPWWTIADLLEGIMDDDVAAYYSKAMHAELEAHPNYFNGSADEWKEVTES